MYSISNLEYYRRLSGQSRIELSKRSGVSAVMIGKYERNEKDLKMAAYITVKALADALGVSADDLFDTEIQYERKNDYGTEKEKQSRNRSLRL